ncbi:halocin C8-like domain-containing protein [Halococcus agarilyticus]|uniref:halocin C8-like domain-containing protein n=1 Tax=Halococcus agarilyticus TaxID=1232219 RepID=UPI0018966BC7|nr:halocin C8-like domain-containing protein [Halococcus agarilyticus]
MGTGAVGVAGLGTVSGASRRSDGDAGVESLSGNGKREAVAIARDTPEFELLRNELEEEYSYRLDQSKTQVFEGDDDDGNPYHVVSFHPVSTGVPEDSSEVDLAITLKHSSFYDAGATITEYEGESGTVTLLTTSGGVVETESAALGRSVSSDAVTVQSSCSICRDVSTVICNRGCSLGGATLCAIAGFGTIGSIACAAVVNELCRRYGGNIRQTCRRSNLCNLSGIC